jgi:hypothetical protein
MSTDSNMSAQSMRSKMSLQDFKALWAVAVKWSVRNLFGILRRLVENSNTVAFIRVWQSSLCHWHVTDNKHDVAGKCLIECQIQTLRMNANCVLQCAISGFRHGVRCSFFCDVIRLRLAVIYRRFGTLCLSHLQGWSSPNLLDPCRRDREVLKCR